MIETEGLTHIHLFVADLDRSLRFYREVFGVEELFRDCSKMVFVRPPNTSDTITPGQEVVEIVALNLWRSPPSPAVHPGQMVS
jgi:catechol 2,3-dioxygenase-like lactoylglutathione lyase family enzyme